jgi:hypothetical protein
VKLYFSFRIRLKNEWEVYRSTHVDSIYNICIYGHIGREAVDAALRLLVLFLLTTTEKSRDLRSISMQNFKAFLLECIWG